MAESVRYLDIIDKAGNITTDVPIGSSTKYILHRNETLENLLDNLNIGGDDEFELSAEVDKNKVTLTLKQGNKVATTEFSPNDVENWDDIQGKPTLIAGTNITLVTNEQDKTITINGANSTQVIPEEEIEKLFSNK